MEQTIIRRFTVDKIATLQEKIGNKFLCDIRKNQLNNTDFTIISNNCWGGVYIEDIIYHIHHQQWGYIFLQMSI